MAHLIDKNALIAEIKKLKSNLMYGACSSQIAMEARCKKEAYNEVLAILDTMQEESTTSVWHYASEIPEIGKKLLIICYSGNAYAGYHSSISHTSIKQWAYIDDLLKL